MYLHSPIELLKCSNCGEIAYLPGDTKKVDHAVEATIRALTIGFINSITKRYDCSQIVLAAHVGVTPEYISQLKAGSRSPGFQTFNILKVLQENEQAFRISDPAFDLEKIVSQADEDNLTVAYQKLA